MGLYEELGVRPLINASTTLTMYGGSRMPPDVLDAMREAAGAYVDIHDLHARAGQELARLTRNEAAYVTPGCSAAIVLAILGFRTQGDPGRIANLPDDPRQPDEVIIHAAHRYPYDPAVRLAGARFRQIGNVKQTFPWELEAALSERSAAVLYVAGTPYAQGALPLSQVIEISHHHQVPVLVDAAAQLPPVENFWHYTSELGADLAVFSGGKELRGPQASGLMVGGAVAVAAAVANGAPHQRLARAMKVGKEEIAGLVAAVRRFVVLDHAAEALEWLAVCQDWSSIISKIEGATAEIQDRNAAGALAPRVRVDVDPHTVGRDARAIARDLFEGDPGIAVICHEPECFYLEPALLDADQYQIVVDRAVEALLSEQ